MIQIDSASPVHCDGNKEKNHARKNIVYYIYFLLTIFFFLCFWRKIFYIIIDIKTNERTVEYFSKG